MRRLQFNETDNKYLDGIIKGLAANALDYHETQDPIFLRKVLAFALDVEHKKTLPPGYKRNDLLSRTDMLRLLHDRMGFSRLDVADAFGFLLSLAFLPFPGQLPDLKAIENIDNLFRKKPDDAVPEKYGKVRAHAQNHIDIALINRLPIRRSLSTVHDILRPNNPREQRNIDGHMKMIAGEMQNEEALIDRTFLDLVRLRRFPDVMSPSLSPDQRRMIMERTFYTICFYAPIAERLGRGHLKTALLDEVVRIIDPEEFENLKQFRDEQRQEESLLDAVVYGMKKIVAKTPYADYCHIEGDMKSISSIYFKMKRRLGKKEKTILHYQGELRQLGEEVTGLKKAGRFIGEIKEKAQKAIVKSKACLEKAIKELEDYSRDLALHGGNPIARPLLEKYLFDLWRARTIFDSTAYQKAHGISLDAEGGRGLEAKAVMELVTTTRNSGLFVLNQKEEQIYIGKTRKPNGYEAAHLVGTPTERLMDDYVGTLSAAAQRAFEKSGFILDLGEHEQQWVGSESHNNNTFGMAAHAGYKHGSSVMEAFKRAGKIVVRTVDDDPYEISRGATAVHLAAAIHSEKAAMIGKTVFRTNEPRGIFREEIPCDTPLGNGDRIELSSSALFYTNAAHRRRILGTLRGSEKAGVRRFYDKMGLS